MTKPNNKALELHSLEDLSQSLLHGSLPGARRLGGGAGGDVPRGRLLRCRWCRNQWQHWVHRVTARPCTWARRLLGPHLVGPVVQQHGGRRQHGGRQLLVRRPQLGLPRRLRSVGTRGRRRGLGLVRGRSARAGRDGRRRRRWVCGGRGLLAGLGALPAAAAPATRGPPGAVEELGLQLAERVVQPLRPALLVGELQGLFPVLHSSGLLLILKGAQLSPQASLAESQLLEHLGQVHGYRFFF
mmetsp:Transcript_88444/g.258513  ORF Transcript_88444/g.258513 Transcript_88444/m.258513 type:complete len:242 (-) Transcript_88444:511-1236(-)